MYHTARRRDLLSLSTIGLLVAAVALTAGTSCRSRYSPTRRTAPNLEPGWPQGNNFFQAGYYPRQQASLPEIPDAEYVNDDEFCATCHEAYVQAFAGNVHHGIHEEGQSCEACHGPGSLHLETRGKEPGLILSFKTLSSTQKSELCARCHENDACAPGSQWRYSRHAQCGVACTDCHTSHYGVPPGTPATTELGATAYPHTSHSARAAGPQPSRSPAAVRPTGAGNPVVATGFTQPAADGPSPMRRPSNNLGAVAPYVCYKCHGDMREFQAVAGPHQILGPNGFNCTTCHDAHGNIRESTRVDLCLRCHGQGAPVTAWHTATHALEGVACTDCHNPHPSSRVLRFANISHTQVRRPRRLQMAVDEPEVCYKCHQKIFGMNALPSHHPIKEGKMVCSDCHDPHGQMEGNLKAESLNMVCYKCHADKQGPFAYEHPPVTENCGICHEAHGTVANNLLRQPTTFLCLRCHSGHRGGPSFHDFGSLPDFVADSGPFRVPDADRPRVQASFYTDCTQCHNQIHGSDVPTPHRPGTMMR